MIEIRFVCNQEKLTPAEKPVIASGDVNSVQLRVEFCQKWDEYAKTAVFFRKEDPTPIEIPMLQNACIVPPEVLAESGTFYFGIRGVDTDDTEAEVLTSDVIGYRVVDGAPSGVEVGPTPDVYQQILTNYGKMDRSKQNKLAWVTDADIDAMFAGTYEGTEDEDPEGDGYRPGGENTGASTYYSTTREELGEAYEDTDAFQAKYIYGLYDALMAKYPKNVQKKEYKSTDGTFTNYGYVISTGDYSTDAVYTQTYGNNPPIKKPKYLILSGIHGSERRAVYSTHQFIRDLLRGHNIPAAFREGAIISVMPIGTPSSFDAFTRENGNGVDINRNFEADAPEKETQAIQNWLNANSDADLFIDCHNNGALNEKVLILGLPDNSISNTARKIALRGVDHIIPFWRDVIGYPDKVKADGLDDTDGDGSKVEYRDIVYSYSATVDEEGLAFAYAQEVLGISAIALETAPFHGDHTDFEADMKAESPEAVAMAAEALGNILIEFYTHSCEVMNMANIDSKLDALLQSASFRMERGILTWDTADADGNKYISEYSSGGVVIGATIAIPCSPSPKLVVLRATAETQKVLASMALNTDIQCSTYAVVYNNIVDMDVASNAASQNRNALAYQFVPNPSNAAKTMGSISDAKLVNIDTVPQTTVAKFHNIEGAEYEWTAYYWDE